MVRQYYGHNYQGSNLWIRQLICFDSINSICEGFKPWPLIIGCCFSDVSDVVGKGVFTSKIAEKGTFLCDYDGASISHEEAIAKMESNFSADRHNYVMIFTENYKGDDIASDADAIVTCIDGTQSSGMGKLVNHSCEPNLTLVPVRVGIETPRVCMFASRKIASNEQLSYNYR